MRTVSAEQLIECGLDAAAAADVATRANERLRGSSASDAWRKISQNLLNAAHPMAVHHLLHEAAYAGWDQSLGLPPMWTPDEAHVASTNVAWLARHAGVSSYPSLHEWTVRHRESYWRAAVERLNIRLRRACDRFLDTSKGAEAARWLVGARMNIVDSCFSAAPSSPAIVHQSEGGAMQVISVAQLESLTNRVAHSLSQRGIKPGDAFAIVMPMTALSVAIYLGIIKAGGVVVSIPDSFSPGEIATRLRLGNAVAVFTQDVIIRGGKELPLYANVTAAGPLPAIVLPASGTSAVELREGDVRWDGFLGEQNRFEAVERDSDDAINILFSSGTTGEPKVIPWSHSTPIKCAADAHFHQDIQPGDVLAWPTNLGWMMGPWLIFASLVNRATIALFDGAPTGAAFGRFIQDAGVTMLGVVPSLVKTWRGSRCMEGFDWSAIKVFSSTGECSNAGDMHYLMSLAGYRPVIEYCGGTEIGGGYITGTVALPMSPATFNTPALGLDFVIVDEHGAPASNGEVFLTPPSIGLSEKLLNQDHHAVYYAGAPDGPDGETLRRHGDQIERLDGWCWRAHGRADDTMNLAGIKVSSAEIERVVVTLEAVQDAAAIAVPTPGGGPSQLVVHVVPCASANVDAVAWPSLIQQVVRRRLNPLFKVHDVVIVDALPRTASNKVMRRVLRDRYCKG